jgi:succinate dehydrogenase/fumarate reductase-like Fe-S protein
MPPRLKAILLLAVFLVKTVFRRLFTSNKSGIALFRAHYDADGLPPVSLAEREEMPAFSRCIACGLCDRGEASRIEASGGAYRGVMALVLAGSRSMPDYRAAAYSFSFVNDDVLAQKEKVCPTGVPFSRIARFVREKARAVGGPLPLPPRIESLPPRSE